MIAALLLLLQVGEGGAGIIELEGGARNPAFARDGRVAIEARGDIWIADSAGPGAQWRRVTSGGAWDRAPAWTHDGKAIVFSSDRRGGDFDLWRVSVNAIGAPLTEPTRITTTPGIESEPAVAPDGSIVFARGRGAGADLWIRTARGRERQLTREAGAERWPAVSPDGRRIAYAATRNGTSHLHVMDIDGANDRELLASQPAEYPRWSPDGARIAFTSAGQRPGVWLTDADGSAAELVAGRRAVPAWSPDAARLLLVEAPLEGTGGYNGDPDRVGDRDVGDLWPSTGRMWIAPAKAGSDSLISEIPLRLPVARAALNAEAFDRVHSRVERVYLSSADASRRRDEWRAVGSRLRARAVAARTDDELDDAIWEMLRQRPTLRAPATGRAAVSSAHPVATAAGVEMFARGGNVVDAAVAVSFALGVVEPDASGIGGYGQMLVHLKGMAEPTLIEFMTAVPELASITNTAFPAGGRFPSDGPVLANVPGTVAAMHLAWTKYGSRRLAWAQLIEPAIRAAEKGYEVSDGLATTLSVEREGFLKYPASRALFFRDGVPRVAGETVRNPDLAWTLREIAKGGADAFYRGTVARRMVDALSKEGNAIRLPDLDRYEARERPPVSGTFRGNAIYASGPPVAGGTTLIAELNALEQFTAPRPYTEDAASLHAVIEAWKLAPRGARIADPAIWPVNIEPAISKDAARARWACFDPMRASAADVPATGCAPPATPPPPSRAALGRWTPECDGAVAGVAVRTCRSTGTTAYAVADADGNMVSTTQTLGTWGGGFYVSPGLGFLYNDKVTSYGTDANAPGARVAGARHGSTITPTLAFRGTGPAKEPWFAIGAAGNAWITSAVYQTFVGIADGGLGPQAALELPRFQTGRRTADGVVLQMEQGVAPQVLRQLETMGHRFEFISLPGEVRQGYGAAVVIQDGRVTAGADPRRAGAAGAVPR